MVCDLTKSRLSDHTWTGWTFPRCTRSPTLLFLSEHTASQYLARRDSHMRWVFLFKKAALLPNLSHWRHTKLSALSSDHNNAVSVPSTQDSWSLETHYPVLDPMAILHRLWSASAVPLWRHSNAEKTWQDSWQIHSLAVPPQRWLALAVCGQDGVSPKGWRYDFLYGLQWEVKPLITNKIYIRWNGCQTIFSNR